MTGAWPEASHRLASDRPAIPDWLAAFSGRAVLHAPAASWGREDLQAHLALITAALAGCTAADFPVGLIADNGPDWIAVDLAMLQAGRTLVPLPSFFTDDQLAHAMRATGMRALWCADPGQAQRLGFEIELFRVGNLGLHERKPSRAGGPGVSCAGDIRKITFTSGTTGSPKGVCLRAAEQLHTAGALASVIAPLGVMRHLNLLPMAVLLENIAGVYAPLLAGASCACPPLAAVGLAGASAFDAQRCLDAIAEYDADSVIVLPQMLAALVATLALAGGRDRRARSLKFMAVGGARTPPALITRARQLGLPAYEGYGLSECASVVCLNLPGGDRVGTVGRVLPGMQLRVSGEGELEVSGRRFVGYLGEPPAPSARPDQWLRTGDLGSVDADGFVSISGRRGNVLITGYGRNVSPEWPESLLLESGLIAQVAVFGEGRPFLAAVIVASRPDVGDDALQRAIDAVSLRLPDYARIGAWLRAGEAFTPANGLSTANGRLRRQAIEGRYAQALNQLYPEESHIP